MKRSAKWIIKLLFTISLFILIFNPRLFGIQRQFIPVTLGSLWAEITGIEAAVFFRWMLLAVVIQAAAIFSSMLRWDLLLKAQSIRLPFRHIIGTFLVGRFFGMFLPSTIGLDGYRLFDIAKHTGKVAASATVILTEKLIGFVALSLLVFLTLPLGLRLLPIKPLLLGAVLGVLAVFIAVSLVMLFNPRIVQMLIALLPIPAHSGFRARLEKITAAIASYESQRGLLAKALILGFCVHACTALVYFATAMALKTTGIHIFDVLFASPLMIYGTVIGPSIGGEGIREIVFAVLLGAKAGTTKAVLFAHLGFWVGEFFSLAGGIIYLLRPAEYRPETAAVDQALQTAQVPPAQTAVTNEELGILKANIRTAFAASITAGVWAGFLIGLLEGLVVMVSFDSLPEKTVLFWGPLAYGMLGGLLGMAAALAAAGYTFWRLRAYRFERLWTMIFVMVYMPLAFSIARFRIVRDLLHERPLSLPENLGLVVLFVIAGAILYWLGSRLLRNSLCRLLATGYPALALWILLPAFVFGFDALKTSLYQQPEKPLTVSPSQPAPNIIFIMADALRIDHLTAYGYTKNQLPAIESLAADAMVFTQHFAQSSWTKPQAATLLTSLYPSTHATYLKPHVLPDKIETLAEVLKKTGYATAGITSNINLSPVFNFQQGFDYYRYLAPDYFFYARESSSKLCVYDVLRLVRERFFSQKKYVGHYYQDARVVTEQACAWLAKAKEASFFLFLHYMDPHDPYFAHPYNGEAVARLSQPNPPAELAGYMRGLYDQDIAYLDESLGQLFGFLKQNGLYDNTLILFTADHGEEFNDHGGWWHGTTLYDEVIHVPLLVKLPGNKGSGTRNERIVQSIDLAPALIEAAGGTVPAAMQGRSFLAEKDFQVLPVFSEEDHENNVIKSLRIFPWKLIITREGSPRMAAPVQLFDLEHDPAETRNLAGAHPDVVQRLRVQLDAISAQARAHAYAASAHQPLDQATQSRLKALGYVE